MIPEATARRSPPDLQSVLFEFSQKYGETLADPSGLEALIDAYRNDLQQLASMKEIIDLFYQSMGIDRVVIATLVAVTAGQGFGFNRAFFLGVCGNTLQGRLGIGPANADEAHGIWGRLNGDAPSLRETLDQLSEADDPPDRDTQEMARRIQLPLDQGDIDGSSGIVASCLEGKPGLVSLIDNDTLPELEVDLFDLLGSDTIAVVPLRVQDRLEGVILADNHITRKPITEADLDLLRTFSGYAAIAVERSNLNAALEGKVEELRQANRELQDNQRRLLRAEKLSALGEMSAYVSHEIRNPLVGIGGLARSLLGDRGMQEDAREALEIISSEVERLERFLDETLSQVKTSRAPSTPIDLVREVRDVVHVFREGLVRPDIEITLTTPDTPVLIPVDIDPVRGALSNLLKNAQEALDTGGGISVQILVKKDWIQIDVEDTGSGIVDELKDVIFEPFFTTKNDGTGVGLAITRQNIRKIGGEITLDKSDEFLTLFRIRIPVHLQT
jgi:signal transduction histidine kinase